MYVNKSTTDDPDGESDEFGPTVLCMLSLVCEFNFPQMRRYPHVQVEAWRSMPQHKKFFQGTAHACLRVCAPLPPLCSAAAHPSDETQMIVLNDRLAVGVYNAESDALPSATINGQELKVDDFGLGVDKGVILIMDFGETSSGIGTALRPNSAEDTPATQVLTAVRWDADGNKISGVASNSQPSA